MMKNEKSLQDKYLDTLVMSQAPASIYLSNGVQLKGKVVEHDDETVLLSNHAAHVLVYKQAIATIVPSKAE